MKNAITLCDKMKKPHYLTEVAKERIRRAAKRIVEENPEAKFDGGFRVLKCDSSNMKDVYYNPAEYEPSLFQNLKIISKRTELRKIYYSKLCLT